MADTPVGNDLGIGGRLTPTGRTRRWPIVFRSLGQALQGPRLGVALIAFVILMACGALWDGLSPNRVEPGGQVTEQQVRAASLFPARQAGVLDEARYRELTEDERITFAQARAAIIESYRTLTDQAALELVDAEPEQAERIRTRLARYEEGAANAIEGLERYRSRGIFRFTVDSLAGIGGKFIAGLWTLNLTAAWAGLGNAWGELGDLLRLLWDEYTVFSVAFGLLFILLFCLAGAAISRQTALDLSEGRVLSWTQGVGFAIARLRDVLVGLLFFPIVAIVLGVIVAIVWGILLGLPVLNIIGALLYFLALIFGLLIVLIGVGFLGCFSLMVPAIAVEQTDGYDAQQRAYGYLLARPGHLLLYTLLALVQGAVALTLIWFIALATLNVTAWLAGFIGGDDVIQMAGGWSSLMEERQVWMLSGTGRFAAGVIEIWRALVTGLVAAFIISFYFTSQTIIYFLMRWTVDGEAIERSDIAGAAP